MKWDHNKAVNDIILYLDKYTDRDGMDRFTVSLGEGGAVNRLPLDSPYFKGDGKNIDLAVMDFISGFNDIYLIMQKIFVELNSGHFDVIKKYKE